MDYEPNWPYLETVRARIGHAVMSFYMDRLRRNACQFHADDLRSWVIRKVSIAAPGSADRILRDLRQRKQLDYTVLSRADSLYEFHRIAEQQSLF